MSRKVSRFFTSAKTAPSIFDTIERAKKDGGAFEDDSIHELIKSAVSRSAGRPVKITPKIARDALAECTYEGQRKINSRRVERQIRRIRNGSWNPDLSTVTFAELDGRLHCVNGHHRLHAIVNCGSPTFSHVVVTRADTIDDVGRMYASFDEPSASRNDNEMLDGVGASKRLGLKRDASRALFKALSLVLNDLEPMGPRDATADARDRDIRLEAMPMWAPECQKFSEIADLAISAVRRRLYTQGVSRAELTPAQRASAIKRRREIWAALHPGGISGTTCPTNTEERGRGRPKEFASDTAERTGESKKDINRHLSRAEALGDDLAAVVGTSLDKGVELDALKRLPEPERRNLIDRAKSGEHVSARPFDHDLNNRLVRQCLAEIERVASKVEIDEVRTLLSGMSVSLEAAAVAAIFAESR